MKRPFLLILLILFILSSASGDDITFEGGNTSIRTQAGRQVITLSQGAHIQSGSIILKADTITLYGDGFRYASCLGGLSLVDEERNLKLKANRLLYDRETEEILIEGYVELDDPVNELIARGFGLEYMIGEQKITLNAEVTLEKHTSSGAMVCKADVMDFDRNAMSLLLSGRASVDWAGDRYEAQQIVIDLEREEITAEGSIRGVIHG
jgi:lipopolysaccharide export system protein LptA